MEKLLDNMIIINDKVFKKKDVTLPVSVPGGSKKKLIGFDATIFKNRKKGEFYGNWDDVKRIITDKYSNVSFISDKELYLKNLDLYIDSRLDYVHNFNAYNPDNLFHIDCLNQLIDGNQKDIILQWCIKDPEKRKMMTDSGKKYLEIYNFYDADDLHNQIRRATSGLIRKYDEKCLERELKNIHKSSGNYNSTPIYNKIISHFNCGSLFFNENEHYKNPINRRKHLENCSFLQYIPEHELTDEKILTNYRFNKYVSYYSYFSPMWAKAFIEEFQPKRVLDLFGGWGHRYLAFLDHEYIYNDFWDLTYSGVLGIHEFCKTRLKLPEKIFYNEDAKFFKFNQVETYDTIFTCPPYENLEKYNNKVFKNQKDFLDLWENSVNNSIHQDLKIFSFIIKNSYASPMIDICKNFGLSFYKEIPIGANINHHYNRQKTNKKLEHLYVFIK